MIVLEGAGSPAEINLKQHDIVNMRMAEMADASCLLVGDIDRGGVFASLLGTIELLDEDERARIGGFVINKFRGDVALLEPGVGMMEGRIQKPCLGVVPYLEDLALEEEDSLGLPEIIESVDSSQWLLPLRQAFACRRNCVSLPFQTLPTLMRFVWNLRYRFVSVVVQRSFGRLMLWFCLAVSRRSTIFSGCGAEGTGAADRTCPQRTCRGYLRQACRCSARRSSILRASNLGPRCGARLIADQNDDASGEDHQSWYRKLLHACSLVSLLRSRPEWVRDPCGRDALPRRGKSLCSACACFPEGVGD